MDVGRGDLHTRTTKSVPSSVAPCGLSPCTGFRCRWPDPTCFAIPAAAGRRHQRRVHQDAGAHHDALGREEAGKRPYAARGSGHGGPAPGGAGGRPLAQAVARGRRSHRTGGSRRDRPTPWQAAFQSGRARSPAAWPEQSQRPAGLPFTAAEVPTRRRSISAQSSNVASSIKDVVARGCERVMQASWPIRRRGIVASHRSRPGTRLRRGAANPSAHSFPWPSFIRAQPSRDFSLQCKALLAV